MHLSKNHSLLAWMLITCSVFFGSAITHDTPDDFTERAIALVVKDRQIEISVQIGINAKTMRDKLTEWKITEKFDDENELTNRFCSEIQTRLLKNFELCLDDEQLELSVTSVDPFAEHHKTAVMKLVAVVPEGIDQGQISFTDTSFMKLDGAVRFAIKGRGNAIVTQSNVAPIIIRAKRIELGGLSKEQRKAACQIQARIKIVGKR